MKERWSARPWGYAKVMFFTGTFLWYYDYRRRVYLEGCLEKESERRIMINNRHLDRIRVGEEGNYLGVMEYLT